MKTILSQAPSADTLIGILGGTFDPVHFGHLRMALELHENLAMEKILFVPCRIPVHKEKVYANVDDRLAMLQLAIAGQPGFVIDEREIRRDTSSYMVLTLESLREEAKYTLKPLCLIVGIDALATLSSWYRWHDFLSLCHIIGVTRPDFKLPKEGETAELLRQKRIEDPESFARKTCGFYLFATNHIIRNIFH